MTEARVRPPWIGVLAVFGIAAFLYYRAASGRQAREDQPLRPAPDFALPDLEGRMVRFSSFRGRVVLLDFWATWCEPCQEELPELKKLHRKYKDRGFTIVGVSMDVLGRQIVAPFVRENKVPYPVLLAEGLRPPEGYALPGLPTAFLIGREGAVVRRYLGPKLYGELAKDVEDVLAR